MNASGAQQDRGSTSKLAMRVRQMCFPYLLKRLFIVHHTGATAMQQSKQFISFNHVTALNVSL